MKTKVITLEHVPLTYRVRARRIWIELLEGFKIITGAGCLFFVTFVLAMILYAYGG